MIYTSKKPFYASINWSTYDIWQCLSAHKDEVGGINGVKLCLEYAKRQGVKLEWLEKGDIIEFYIAKKGAYRKSEEAISRFSEKLFNEILEFGEPMPTACLKAQFSSDYPSYKEAIELLLAQKRIMQISQPPEGNGRGRPSILYDITI